MLLTDLAVGVHLQKSWFYYKRNLSLYLFMVGFTRYQTPAMYSMKSGFQKAAVTELLRPQTNMDQAGSR